MAKMEISRKVNYIGIWQEDTFSDEVMKNIAAHTKAEKGKRVKVIINTAGLTIIKSRVLKDNVVSSYPIDNIKTVTKNARMDECVMFILSGSVSKYKIIVVKCDSDADAIYITNFFNQFKQNSSVSNVELQKQLSTGRWSLRERSALNASLHLKEVFREQEEENQNLNGDINGNEIITDKTLTPTRAQNGILKHSNSTSEKTFPYTEISVGTTTAQLGGGGQIITATTVKNVKDEDAKVLLHHKKIAEVVSGHEGGNTNMSVNKGTILMPDKPKIQDGRIYLPGPNSHDYRRFSGDLALYKQYQPIRSTPGRNSMIVQFDSRGTARGSLSYPVRPSSMRVASSAPQKFTTRSTLRRSIEDTYAKPVILQTLPRRGSGNSIVLARNSRPSSIHVMGGNRLQIVQDLDGMKL